MEPGQTGAAADGGEAGQRVEAHIQLRKIRQAAQDGQIGDGIVLKVQLRQGGHAGQGFQLLQSVAPQIQKRQILGTFQTGQGAQGALRHGQAGQGRQGTQNFQVVHREAAARQIQHHQLAQGRQAFQRRNFQAVDGQARQIGQVGQVTEILGSLRNGELRNAPQSVGVNRGGGTGVDQLPDGGLHGLILEFRFFDDAGDGVIQVGNPADKAVFLHGNGTDLGFACGQGNAAAVAIPGHGGVISVGGVENGISVGGQVHINILAEKAGLLIGLGCGRTLILNFLADGTLRNLLQQGNRVQELILLHEHLAQGGVQLHRGIVPDGGGQGQLGLGVVAGFLVLVGKLNGHVFVMTGEIVGAVIEPGGKPGIAVYGLIPGLAQQGVPGEGPVINEQVPDDAGDNQQQKHQRYQESGCFLHKNTPFPRNHR